MEFPISLKLEEHGDVFAASGTYLRGVDLAPLLVGVAAPVSVVFNVSHSSTDDGAAELGIPTTVHELDDGREALVVASTDLPAFFAGFRQLGGFDVDVLDWPAPPTAAEVGGAVAAVERPVKPRRLLMRRREQRLGGFVLSALTHPTFYYHGHDDIYFSLESRTDRLARLVLRRLIAGKAGSAWRRQQVTVPDPDEDVATRLLGDSLEWTGEIAESTPESVSIALTPHAWRGVQRSPRQPSYFAVFDVVSQGWELRRYVA